jgi:hypothetical protein
VRLSQLCDFTITIGSSKSLPFRCDGFSLRIIHFDTKRSNKGKAKSDRAKTLVFPHFPSRVEKRRTEEGELSVSKWANPKQIIFPNHPNQSFFSKSNFSNPEAEKKVNSSIGLQEGIRLRKRGSEKDPDCVQKSRDQTF